MRTSRSEASQLVLDGGSRQLEMHPLASAQALRQPLSI